MNEQAGLAVKSARTKVEPNGRGHSTPSSEVELITQRIDGLQETLRATRRQLPMHIVRAAAAVAGCFQEGGKLLICGNGGSAAEAQHLAAEFVGRFKYEGRRGLPALALTADSAVVSAWSNDIGYDRVFARQVEAFGQPGDVLLGISTSGQSMNLVHAFEIASDCGLERIALLGKDGGALHELADIAIVVPSDDTQHIQEVQLLIIHLVCELVEEQLQR